VDGGGCDVLGRGAKKRSGKESGTAAGASERAQVWSGEGKRRGFGSVLRGGKIGAQREGPGCGAA
jgi:hypothetical protein